MARSVRISLLTDTHEIASQRRWRADRYNNGVIAKDAGDVVQRRGVWYNGGAGPGDARRVPFPQRIPDRPLLVSRSRWKAGTATKGSGYDRLRLDKPKSWGARKT